VFFFSGPRVYLEIDESRLFIGRLKKKKGYFLCDRFDEWPLTSFEVKDGVIYKPSVLYLLIRSFLKDHRLRGSQAVVCCPYLAYWKGVDKRMPFFQAALYVSKAGLKIHSMLSEGILTEHNGVNESKFFHQDKLKSRFDFFCHFRLKNRQPLLRWLGGSVALLASVGVGLAGLQVATYRQGSILRHDKVDLSDRIAHLQHNMQQSGEYVQTNQILKTELARLASIKNQKWGIVLVLQALTQMVPPNTWINTMSFGHDRSEMALSGSSASHQEIMAFYRKITGNGLLADCSLKYAQEGNLFSFTISGKVPS